MRLWGSPELFEVTNQQRAHGEHEQRHEKGHDDFGDDWVIHEKTQRAQSGRDVKVLRGLPQNSFLEFEMLAFFTQGQVIGLAATSSITVHLHRDVQFITAHQIGDGTDQSGVTWVLRQGFTEQVVAFLFIGDGADHDESFHQLALFVELKLGKDILGGFGELTAVENAGSFRC